MLDNGSQQQAALLLFIQVFPSPSMAAIIFF